MMKTLHRLLDLASSLRLTMVCLAAALVLVFAGTLAQVKFGLFLVQEEYFQSWFVWWHAPSGDFRIPIFPGGHQIGAVLLVNLIASHIRRFSWSWRKTGIQLIHLGLIIMLAGGLATDLFSVSSYMRLREGETKNYSEDNSGRMELAVIEHGDDGIDQVTAIPDARIADVGEIRHETLPFSLKVVGFYQNSDLRMIAAGDTAVPASSMGTGKRVSVSPKSQATRLDERNVMSAVVEIVPFDGAPLGTWLVSDAFAAEQTFEVANRRWSIGLRPIRYYKPYSLTLHEFTHETYPGTTIPKNFSSKVDLVDPEAGESRPALIYMNNPLRYQGETFYQSGFERDNSGTILQVVRNPGYQAPYVACLVVSVGLIYQFSIGLAGFVRRRQPANAS